MRGISVSLLFAIVTRLASRSAGFSRKEDRTTWLGPRVGGALREERRQREGSLERRGKSRISAERLQCRVTGDGVRTIVGICVVLLIVSAGLATAYISCVRLLILLVRVSASLLLHFGPP